MLLVIPVSLSDRHLIPQVERAFKEFNPGSGHDLLVVSSPDAKLEAEALMSSLSQYFNTTQVYTFVANNKHGWPFACNFFFQQACYHVSQNLASDKKWMWFELDTIPIKPNWLSMIHQECVNEIMQADTQSRLPAEYLGVKMPTIKGKNGEQMDQEDAGFHMAPVGVYPAHMGYQVNPLRAVTAINYPWYYHIQWYITKSLKETDLIQNNWRTGNYRKEGDKIVCDSNANWSWDVHFNAPVSPKAALIHGCKDGSLLDVLLGTTGNIEEKKSVLEQARELAVKTHEEYRKCPSNLEQHIEALPDEAFEETLVEQENSVPPVTEQAEESPAIKMLVPASYKRGPKRGRRSISTEERKRRSEHMRAIHAKRREEKLAATV